MKSKRLASLEVILVIYSKAISIQIYMNFKKLLIKAILVVEKIGNLLIYFMIC